jgi:hypothetical protein
MLGFKATHAQPFAGAGLKVVKYDNRTSAANPAAGV